MGKKFDFVQIINKRDGFSAKIHAPKLGDYLDEQRILQNVRLYSEYEFSAFMKKMVLDEIADGATLVSAEMSAPYLIFEFKKKAG